MAATNVKTASCRCGTVKLEFDAEPSNMYLCHCFNCKKGSGSMFAAQSWFPRSSLKIVAGEDEIAVVKPETTSDGDKPASVGYWCGKCHSFLYVDVAFLKNDFIVGTGIMDDPSYFKPKTEYFTKRRCGWLSPIEGAKQLTEMKE